VKNGVSGYVVEPVPEDIAEALIDYFENNRMEAFTEGVRQEKNRFGWDNMTASVIDVYDQCAVNRKP
jgi:D-inositol-3-phosphate glycosyltransferase